MEKKRTTAGKPLTPGAGTGLAHRVLLEHAPGHQPFGKLVNRPGPQGAAWCGVGARIVTRAAELARRGDVAGLGAALAQAPDLLRPAYAAAIMQAAALAPRRAD